MALCERCNVRNRTVAIVQENPNLLPNGDGGIDKQYEILCATPLTSCTHTICQEDSCNWSAQVTIHLHEVDAEFWDINCCMKHAGAWANYRWSEIPK